MSQATGVASALVLACLMFVAGASAQGVRVQVGAGGSLTFPMSFYHATPSGDGFTPALQGVALVDFKRPNAPVGLRLDVTTGHNSANDSLNAHATAAVGAPTELRTRLFGGNVDLTYNFQPASAVRGYLLGGIGLYGVKVSATSSGATADTSVTRFAWNVGVGLTVGTGAVRAFLEMRYLDVGAFDTIKPTALSTTAGIRLGIGGN
jgi:opacity protein-like surface antigen